MDGIIFKTFVILITLIAPSVNFSNILIISV